MLFLDVTSSCKSAKNTGMQRTTRALYLHLRNRLPVAPICWNRTGRCYQHLGRWEMEILQSPFRVLSKATAKPEWRGETTFAELYRLVFRKRFRLENQVTLSDILIITDFFSGIKTKRMSELIRILGVQHDIIIH